MAYSARGVNDQGQALHPPIAAGGTGPNGRAPSCSPTWILAGLVTGWTSLAENENAGLLVEVSSHREMPRASDPRNTPRTDLGEVGVAIEPIFRPGAAIGVAVGGGLVVSAVHFPPSLRCCFFPGFG